jgi:pimeloyl-ACP methyl ester carboxylesterase
VLIPFGNSADYLKTNPGVTLVLLPGLGHLPHGEAGAGANDIFRSRVPF